LKLTKQEIVYEIIVSIKFGGPPEDGKLHFSGFTPRRTSKFGSNTCLTNIFLHCVYNFLCLAVEKFHFGGFFRRGGLTPWRNRKFGPNNCLTNAFLHYEFRLVLCWANNCLTNNFLHYEFQLSMLSSSKISLWEGYLGWKFAPRKTSKFGPNNCLTNNFLHYEFQHSMLSSSKVWLWGFWGVWQL